MGKFSPRAFLIRLAAFAALAIPVSAVAATYNFNHQCQLEHYNGKTWDVLPPSMLRGRIRDPLTPRREKRLFAIGKEWYRANAQCLTRNEIDPVARIENRPQRTWAVELSGGFAFLLGSRFGERAVTTGGYTETLSAQKSAIHFTLGLTHILNEDLSLRYSLSRMTTSQGSVYTGSATGSKVESHEFYHFGIGITKSYRSGKLRPYLGFDLGYSLDSGLYTLTEFSGIFQGLNGGVDINATGIFAGVRGGADWPVTPELSLFSDLIFQHTFYGAAKVNAATTTLYSVNQTVEGQAMSRLLLSVGVRYWL